MAKIKVHEVAKKVGVTSKEAVEKAKELGIEVKSHLSNLEESDAKRLEESFGKVKKEKKENKESSDKANGPVIIRRQVIMNEEEPKAKQKQEPVHKKGVGFVENDRKKDYNIVYRNSSHSSFYLLSEHPRILKQSRHIHCPKISLLRLFHQYT